MADNNTNIARYLLIFKTHFGLVGAMEFMLKFMFLY